jgi:hypothetical protein
MDSNSRRFTGKAMVISFHPHPANSSAMINEETVIDRVPSSLKISPTFLFWWVLKWGRKRAPALSAFAVIILMFFRAFTGWIKRIGRQMSVKSMVSP